MPRLEPHGIQLWSDYEGASGTHVVTVTDVERVVERLEINGPETLEVALPRSSDAWDDLQRRQVVRLELDDGSVLEYRIVLIAEEHSAAVYGARLTCESPLLELRGPGLCERLETVGVARTQFELLALTPEEHLDAVILPAGPTWITKGTIEPTDPIDVLYDDFPPLRALQVLLERTGGEREFERQTNGTYKLHLRNQRGASATVPQFRLGKNLRRSARRTDDRETITKIYPVGGDDTFGRVTVAEARWEIKSIPVDTGLESELVLEATHRGSQVSPVWQNDVFNGLYVGNPDRTELSLILDTILATKRIRVDSSGLYAVGEELVFFRNAAADDFNYVEDVAQISGDSDRRVEVLAATDVPPARNLAPNPRLDQYTAGNPDNVNQVGTPTTFAEATADEHHQVGSSSLHVVCDAAGEGAEADAVTIAPTNDRPYFAALAVIKLVSGRVRFQLEHSVSGKLPADDARVRAITTVLDTWVTIEIVPGDDTLLAAGTLKLQVLSDSTTAEFYLDAWQLTQTAVNFPLYDGQPAVELWERAVSRFTDDLVSSPAVSYELGAADLSDSVYEFDAITLGGDVLIVDALLALETTVRVLKLGRDWRRPELVELELATVRRLFTDQGIPQRRRGSPLENDRRRLPDDSRASFYHSVNQTFQLDSPVYKSATSAPIAGDGEHYDVGNLHDLVTNNSRITIAVTGRYLIAAAVPWTGLVVAGSAAFRVSLAKNGTEIREIIRWDDPTPAYPTDGETTWSDELELVENDYLELLVIRGGTGVGTQTDVTIVGGATGMFLSAVRR